MNGSWPARAPRAARIRVLPGGVFYRHVLFLGVPAPLLMVLAFIFAFANKQANNTLDGEGKMVDVTFAESAEEQAFTLLGTTGQFVFLYDIDVRRVHIHPFEAVSEIAFQAD